VAFRSVREDTRDGCRRASIVARYPPTEFPTRCAPPPPPPPPPLFDDGDDDDDDDDDRDEGTTTSSRNPPSCSSHVSAEYPRSRSTSDRPSSQSAGHDSPCPR